MIEKSEPWPIEAVRENAGRTAIMAVGVFLAIKGSFADDYAEQALHLGVGSFLLIGGYLASVLKKIVFKVPFGGEFTADMHERIERTEADVNLSEELQSGETVVIEEAEATNSARFLLASIAIGELLASSGVLAGCALHLYLYDADAGGLVASQFENDQRVLDDPPWAPGEGVTGEAYVTAEMQIAYGAQTHDGTFNLSPERQQRHGDLPAVLATPILNNGGRVIGVLTASERDIDPGDSVLLTEIGQEQMIVRSVLVARVLVDLLGWFTDEGP